MLLYYYEDSLRRPLHLLDMMKPRFVKRMFPKGFSRLCHKSSMGIYVVVADEKPNDSKYYGIFWKLVDFPVDISEEALDKEINEKGQTHSFRSFRTIR